MLKIEVAFVLSFVLEANTSVICVAVLNEEEFDQDKSIAPFAFVVAVNPEGLSGVATTVSFTVPPWSSISFAAGAVLIFPTRYALSLCSTAVT